MKKALRFFSLFSAVLFLFSLNINVIYANADSMTLSVQTPYRVTLSVGEHGNVIVDGTEYTGNACILKNVGSVVTYEVSANFLYRIDKVLYNGDDVTDELAGGKFTAPALDGNPILSVSFKFITGGGSSTSTPEPGPGPSVTPVTETPGRVTAGIEKSSTTVKKVPEVKVVEPAVTEEPESEEAEVSPNDTVTVINSSDVSKALWPGSSDAPETEKRAGHAGVLLSASLLLLLGTGTFVYLKKKKIE